jgi:hypothetical protein
MKHSDTLPRPIEELPLPLMELPAQNKVLGGAAVKAANDAVHKDFELENLGMFLGGLDTAEESGSHTAAAHQPKPDIDQSAPKLRKAILEDKIDTLAELIIARERITDLHPVAAEYVDRSLHSMG